MNLPVLIALLVAACLAGYFLPSPLNWIIVLIVVVILIYAAVGERL